VRFCYYGYYRNLKLTTEAPRSQLWFGDGDSAYFFPNDEGLTLAMAFPMKEKLAAFKADLEGSFLRYLTALPDAPDFSSAEREGSLLGMLELDNAQRPGAHRGMALVGDAALTSDPLFGVGCGWAFQSAEWLVDATADALRAPAGDTLARGLSDYGRTHRRRLGIHHRIISDVSAGKPTPAPFKWVMRTATRDPYVAAVFQGLAARSLQPLALLSPAVLWRTLRHQLLPG
jgi:flavin-dependent dehydrogenase